MSASHRVPPLAVVKFPIRRGHSYRPPTFLYSLIASCAKRLRLPTCLIIHTASSISFDAGWSGTLASAIRSSARSNVPRAAPALAASNRWASRETTTSWSSIFTSSLIVNAFLGLLWVGVTEVVRKLTRCETDFQARIRSIYSFSRLPRPFRCPSRLGCEDFFKLNLTALNIFAEQRKSAIAIDAKFGPVSHSPNPFVKRSLCAAEKRRGGLS